ncbi:MAG: hypothetical protein ACREFX_00890 [Opitutaceae bacterium]
MTAETLSPRLELLDARPEAGVSDAEYWRLLGYPRRRAPEGRAAELAAQARRWYAENGRPWVYAREVGLGLSAGTLRLDDRPFRSERLRELLGSARASRAVLVVASAGRACEAHAQRLWEEGKPDEYYFLEMFGSAVVERLVAGLNGRLCDLAAKDGLAAIPHYSPGYAGWDVAEQCALFESLVRGRAPDFPEPIEVLPSGMLVPKKSLLAVVGLTADIDRAKALAGTPCESCPFSPCRYRRAAYRFAASGGEAEDGAEAPSGPVVFYRVGIRALEKWARERIRIERRADGTFAAIFRFDGTTCSNLGRPLAFEYRLDVGRSEDGYAILEAGCRPAPGDDGYTQMCAYLRDPEDTLRAIREEHPPVGLRLRDALGWAGSAAPSGCHCTAENRAHKWGLALEAIHYALTHEPIAGSGPSSSS